MQKLVVFPFQTSPTQLISSLHHNNRPLYIISTLLSLSLHFLSLDSLECSSKHDSQTREIPSRSDFPTDSRTFRRSMLFGLGSQCLAHLPLAAAVGIHLRRRHSLRRPTPLSLPRRTRLRHYQSRLRPLQGDHIPPRQCRFFVQSKKSSLWCSEFEDCRWIRQRRC